jgi:dTDP-glucose pyrophosphorylase
MPKNERWMNFTMSMITRNFGRKHCNLDRFRLGWIDADQLRALATPLAKTGYGRYLLRVVEEQIFG